VSNLTKEQWLIKESSSVSYQIVWWHDERARDSNNRLSPFSAIASIGDLLFSRRMLLREICEALGDHPTTSLVAPGIGRDKEPTALKNLVVEAFRTGRLVVLKNNPKRNETPLSRPGVPSWETVGPKSMKQNVPIQPRRRCCSAIPIPSMAYAVPTGAMGKPVANDTIAPDMNENSQRLPSVDGAGGSSPKNRLNTASAINSPWVKHRAPEFEALSETPIWAELLLGTETTWFIDPDIRSREKTDAWVFSELDRFKISKTVITDYQVLADGFDANVRSGIGDLLRRYVDTVDSSLTKYPEIEIFARNIFSKYILEIQNGTDTSPAEKNKKRVKETKKSSALAIDATKPSPIGKYLVEISIGKKGDAKAEVLGRIPSSTSTPRTKEASKELLCSIYGLTVIEKRQGPIEVVRGDPKTQIIPEDWTDTELSAIVDALELVAVEDREVLRYVQLVRVREVPTTMSPGANVSGFFQAVAAQDSSLVFDDDVFKNYVNVHGTVEALYPYSFETILHEVGHAISKCEFIKKATVLRVVKQSYEEMYDQYHSPGGLFKKHNDAITKKGSGKISSAEFNAIKKEHDEFKKALDKAKEEMLTASKEVDKVYSDGEPRRVWKFFDLVKKTQSTISPLTQYARDSWPQRPGEFFAEAYMLFLLEPKFLKQYYARIHEFFEKGLYR
jgi:hypothetical protein